MSAPAPGRKICNRYVLLERIGSGGHGEIWRAHDEEHGTIVALKFLHDDLAASVEAWAILNHESQMARRLNHPGVLETGKPIRDGDRTVLPMEYAGGGDLRRLRGQSYLRSVPVLIRIAEILAHAHARGVVHRDLKPGNVLFDEEGGVRLADFGASGLSGSRESHAQGSPFTASPQQLMDQPASPADDVYGLGALAYELLSGYPPYYPDFSVERVLNEPVPELKPAQPAPVRLVALVMRMLSRDPAERPAGMGQVIEGLNQALSDTLAMDGTRELDPALIDGGLSAPPLPPTDPDIAVLPLPSVPMDSRPPRVVPLPTQGPLGGSRLLPLAGWLAAAGVVGALVLVAWVAGRSQLQQEMPVADTVAAATAQPGADAGADPTADTGADAADPATDASGPPADPRGDAAQAREAFEAALAALERRGVAQWGGEAFARAKAAGEAAGRELAAGRHAEAARGFASATAALAAVEGRAGDALAVALSAGRTALDSNQDALARQAFEQALAIDPRNTAATEGLAQAQRLREALGRLADGVKAEAAGDVEAASAAYGDALRLVPTLQAAADARARLGGTRAADEFSRYMARGYEALRAERYTDARAAFERSLRARPGSAEAEQGLAQVEAALAASDYEGLRREGLSLEAQERWHEARDAYRRALARDPALRFAQQGAERASVRAELSDRLDAYLAEPDRLAADAVREEAREWIERARPLATGPVLRSQVDRVSLLLEQYSEPVQVEVASDGNTLVTVLRVGELGAFDARQIRLPPGEYTFVGTRTGFRDVRRQVRIAPGRPPPPILVACTEPIG